MKSICFLAVMGLFFVAGGTVAQEHKLAPKIVCDESVFDFGEHSNSGFVEHDFPIRNEGTLSLEIREVTASCGCTAVKPSQEIIPPGGNAVIQSKFDLRGRNGFQQKTITVRSNDPSTPALELHLKGTALQGLRVHPSALFFGKVGPGDVRSRVCEISSTRGPFQITELRADHPGLLLTRLPSDPDADGTKHKFEMTLDPALPECSLNGTIFVTTDQPGQGVLTITVAAFIAP